MGKLGFPARLCLITSLAAAIASGQTATTGLLQGTITDPSGAAIPGATLELSDNGTGNSLRQTSNSEGQYLFANLPPGDYSMKVSANGFSTSTLPTMRIVVTQGFTQDFKLEVGQATQTVVVTAESRVELQTVDATVGNVIPGRALPTLPTFTRQANELLTLQPGATPAGEVAGARRDQSTLTLDGIDVSNQSVGGLTSYMYLGVESLGEYRVGVANPNASFGRGAGGQVSLVGRRGENRLHGAGFWYHQNDNLNANTWTRNRIGLRKPEAKDNRYGFAVSGPIIKDKTFFFVNMDGRRFPRASTVTRIVPTETLRNGILQFRDASGTVNQYNLRTANTCGPDGTLACDPRGLGLSPTIAALWRLMPAGNDTSQGDGLNTLGLTGNVVNPITYNFYTARLDHQLNSNWRIEASIRYFNQVDKDSLSVDIRSANFQSIRSFPTRQNMEVIALTGAIKPNLTADFRVGRVRQRTATDVLRPSASSAVLNLPGTQTSAGTIALDVGARGGAQNILSEPFDVDTQLARKQQNDAKIYQYNADFTWIKSRHTVQFGGHLRDLPTLHRRDDKVLGALGSLVAQIDSVRGGVINFPNTVAPPSCGGGRTTGCVLTGDLETYYRLFSGVTGIIDNVSVLAARDGSFKPLPFGDLLESDTTGMRAPEFYVQDVWKLKPSLTVTLGMNYGWQTAPKEKLGRYTIQTLTDGTLVTAANFLDQRKQAALAGNFYNPNFSFNPVNNAKRPVFDTDWNNWAPRVAVAWQPAFKSGLLGKMFGDKRTVVRAGYGLSFDRFNTVQGVIIPSLGIGFAQTLNVTAPKCTSGPGCQPAAITNPALNGFRVGVDGSIPLPTVPEQTIPVSPAWGLIGNSLVTFPEILSFQVDPKLKIGENHAVNFTVQREVGGGTIVELGYLGRIAQNLPQSANLLQSPYLFKDRASNQSFAQAFDNIAGVLRANANAALPAQGFFENNMPGGTAALSANRADFVNGNVNNVFVSMDRARLNANLTPFNNLMAQMMLLRTGSGRSNYHGGIATVRKSGKYLDLTFNYTFSKSLDQLGEWQNSANIMPNGFEPDTEYGPSLFDITHIVSAFSNYRLPFKSSHRALDAIVGGWEIANIYTARSGDPLTVVQSSQVWGGALALGFNSGAIPTSNPSAFGNSVNANVPGSANIGTTGDPATRGSGLNMFANPANVFNSFRRVEISKDGRTGRANPLRGLPRWNLDTSVAKSFKLKGGDNPVRIRMSWDFFNIFNNIVFANPTLDLNNSRAFGVLSTQFTPLNRTDGSRWIQGGLRIEF